MADTDSAGNDSGKNNGDKSGNELAADRTDYASDRTDFAEDRTLMANERTFAGWMRTGLAAVGIGLGFNALFGELQPWWLPRAMATALIGIGIFIFYEAQKNGCRVYDRLNSHSAEPLGGIHLRTVAIVMASASAVLVIGIWMMEAGPAG